MGRERNGNVEINDYDLAVTVTCVKVAEKTNRPDCSVV